MVASNPVEKSNGHSKVQKGSLWESFLEHAATATHVLLGGLTVYIIWLCFKQSFSLLTWHVLLYTVGWTFLMTESILYVTKYNILAMYISHTARVRAHWLCLIVGVALSIAGLVVIVVNKENNEQSHFVSDHAITGLASTVFAIPTCINGIAALYNVNLKKFIRPNLNKLFHVVCGFVTVIVGAYATISGYYTGWFRNRVDQSETTIVVCFVITVITLVWAMFRPLLTSVDRIKTLAS